MSLSSQNNTTRPCNSVHLGLQWRILVYIAYTFTFSVGVAGNGVVILTIFIKSSNSRRKLMRKWSTTDMQLISISIADLIGSVAVPVTVANTTITTPSKATLYIGCVVLPTLCMFVTIVSAWMMVAIAVSRLRLIRRSTRTQSSIDFIDTFFILLAWFIAVVVVFPYASTLKIKQNGSCSKDFDSHRVSYFIWTNCYITFWYLLPLLALLIVYPMSYRTLKQNTIRHSVSSLIDARSKRNKRLSALFSTIIIAFAVCTSPDAIFHFLWSYVKQYNVEFFEGHCSLLRSVHYILYFLSSLNCLINPFIYFLVVYARNKEHVKTIMARKHRET